MSDTNNSMISVLTSTDQSLLTKVFKYTSETGEVEKTGSTHLVRGTCRVVELAGLQDLDGLLDQLGSNQAVTYGVPMNGLVEQEVTSRAWATEDSLTRTKDKFHYPAGQPGFLLLDYDPSKYAADVSEAELVAALVKAVPALGAVQILVRPSASNGIVNSDTGDVVTSSSGLHLYVQVDDVSKVPEIGKILYQRLWLNGHGYIALSSSGACLERSCIDAAVWQAERLDYAAAPVCIKPLISMREPGRVLQQHGSEVLSGASVKPLSKTENVRYQNLVREAKRAIRGASRKVRKSYIKQYVKASPLPASEARRTIEKALDGGELSLDFMVTLNDGSRVAVRDILLDPDKYHGTSIPDPLDVEYGRDKAIIYTRQSSPVIHSFAHGEHTYSLRRFESVQGTHITAVDRPCGLGKTIGLFKEVLGKADLVNARIMLVVPDLDEVERYLKNLELGEFIEPKVIKKTVVEGTPATKTEALIEAMQMGKNVVMTHSLYKHIHKFQKYLHRYCVVFDEMPAVAQQVDSRVQQGTIDMLRTMGYLDVAPITQLASVTADWLNVVDSYGDGDGTDVDIKKFMRRVQYSKTYRVTDNYYITPLPEEFFTEPRSLTFITFLLAGSQLDYYMKKIGVHCSIQKDETERREFGVDMKHNLTLYPRVVEGSCSYSKMTAKNDQQRIRVGNFAKKAIKELRQQGVVIDADTVLVSSSKDAWYGKELNPNSKVSDKKRLKSITGLGKFTHISMITRGTNKYRECTVLFLLGKLFMHPDQAKFLGMGGKLKQLDYELSELIQLLYRTAIREGKQVILVAPDARNHKLISDFLK